MILQCWCWWAIGSASRTEWFQAVPQLSEQPPSRTPVAVSARNTTTLITIRARVTTGTPEAERIVFTRVRSRAHSGQRIPTDVGVMQSGQIARPQEEHETPVSRDGWR